MKTPFKLRRSAAIALGSIALSCHGERRQGPPEKHVTDLNDVNDPPRSTVPSAPPSLTARATLPHWPSDLGPAPTLLRLRAHYHEARAAAEVIVESASSLAVRNEAEWLVRVYEHVAAHFDVALREGFGDAAARAPDPLLAEFSSPRSVADPRERERRFSAEATRNHKRLVDFVRSTAFRRIAAGDELLREIRFDVESSQAAQVAAFAAVVHAVDGEHGDR